VDPSLALESDPMCPACAFSKARRISHKTHTGQISKDHINPGDGVSSDGLESGTPGRPFTTRAQRPNCVISTYPSGLIMPLHMFM
jgi:hypothetical protein